MRNTNIITAKQALKALTAAGVFTLAACTTSPFANTPPRARPAGLTASITPYIRSQTSRDLATFYTREQARLKTHDLMRVDGGGPDTPFTAAVLARNFEQIALYSEFTSGGASLASANTPNALQRWTTPVRYAVEFGDSVGADNRATDHAALTRYIDRLARITGHRLAVTTRNPNFLVLISGQDDRSAALTRIRQFIPDITDQWLDKLRDLPRSTHCIVLTFGGLETDNTIERAVALIRAEDPPEMRRSCIHEELAQGLGLLNDSPAARPSIFNDDEEFALLTNHDEMLLSILYDPRLSPGMSAQTARPIVRTIATELVEGAQ